MYDHDWDLNDESSSESTEDYGDFDPSDPDWDWDWDEVEHP